MIDAVSISDRRVVVLKKVTNREFVLHKKILSLPDAPTQFLPIIDVLLLPDTDDHFLIVTPLGHSFYLPLFDSVYEVLQCILQLSKVNRLAENKLFLLKREQGSCYTT